MNFLDGPIEYTIDANVLQKTSPQQEEVNDKEKYQFYVIDNIDNLGNLLGKPMENGGMEYTRTKRWNKTLDEVESEQTTQEQILLRLKNIEEILQKIYYPFLTEVPSIKGDLNAFHMAYIELIKNNRADNRQEESKTQNNNTNMEAISWWKKLLRNEIK